jgi:hypothetical protein
VIGMTDKTLFVGFHKLIMKISKYILLILAGPFFTLLLYTLSENDMSLPEIIELGTVIYVFGFATFVHLVDIRNQIAHGDPLATKTPSDVRDMKSIIQSFCMETDSVFANWWKTQFCSIR